MGETVMIRRADGTATTMEERNAERAARRIVRPAPARQAQGQTAAPILPKRVATMKVTDLRVGDLIANLKTRKALRLTEVTLDAEAGKVTLTTKDGTVIYAVSKSLSVLVH